MSELTKRKFTGESSGQKHSVSWLSGFHFSFFKFQAYKEKRPRYPNSINIIKPSTQLTELIKGYVRGSQYRTFRCTGYLILDPSRVMTSAARSLRYFD